MSAGRAAAAQLGRWGAVAVIVVFMVLPLAAVVGASLSPGGNWEVPLSGLSPRWYSYLINDPEWVRSFVVSVEVAGIVAAMSVPIALMAALGVVRLKPGARTVMGVVALMPIV